MASKAEWESQKRAEQQGEYRSRFLLRLSKVNTFEEAQALALKDIPGQAQIGRIVHSNLLFFLDSIAEERLTLPGQATGEECHAYVALAERMHAAGGLTDAGLDAVKRLK